MIKIKGKIAKNNRMYIAKEIREAIGKKKVEMIGVGKVIVMYPNGEEKEDVIKSVDMALKALELEAKTK